MQTENFGEHIMVDGYEGSRKKLDDGQYVLRCLNDLVVKCGMHKLREPVLVNAPDNQIKDPGGWSGYVLIAESHISIHTFPARGFLTADIYTCRNGLDTDLFASFLRNAFDLKDLEMNFIRRGCKYPEHDIYT